MTDVNPASQGTSFVVQDPKQLQMRDLENMVTPVKRLCDSSGNGSHNYPDLATLGTVQANLATNFEAEPTQPSSDEENLRHYFQLEASQVQLLILFFIVVDF